MRQRINPCTARARHPKEADALPRLRERPRVKVGNRYRLNEGAIEVTSVQEIRLEGVTRRLAKETGFAGVVDLLKTAQHGRGRRVFLVRFR